MNPIVPILIGGAALLALGGTGGGQGAATPPQRVPSVPPGKPPTPQGEERNNDEGRAWGTFYANRDEKKHWELPVFSVAASPGNAAIGTGKVIVNVYETIVANADWEWHGQVCKGARWELVFSAGKLLSYRVIGGDLPCQSVRPMSEIFAQTMRWVQPASTAILTVDTESGINFHTPDKMVVPPYTKPGKYAGTGKFNADDSSSGTAWDTSNPQWDNRNVASGYVTLDASWIFNKA